MIFQIVSFGLIGLLAGILSGLLGIGGGIVTIPCLVLIFSLFGFPSSELMHLAIGTSLAAMVFNTLSASYAHYKKGAVLFQILKSMFPGVILGAFLGATIARFLPNELLQGLFGIFEIILGIRFFFPEREKAKKYPLPSFWPLSMIAFGVTSLSTMLGIGGGMMNVPILTYFKTPIKKAIGTSSALSFLISLCGALSFLILSFSVTNISDSVGFLYIPAFLAISLVSLFAAPFGALLAHHLSTKTLKTIFGGILCVAGLFMVIKSLNAT